MEVSLEQIREESINGYTEYSGIEIMETREGYAFGRVVLQDHHRNPSGAVHGGLTFCLGDVMGGTAVRTLGALPITVSTSISFMRPLLHDQVIYAEAEVIKTGKTFIFVDIRILGEEKQVAAKLQATYYNMCSR